FHQAAMLGAKARGLKILLRDEPTAISKPRGGIKRVVKRRVFGALASLVDGVLAIGTLNRQYWIAQGFDPAKVYSMPYAVDNQRLRAGGEAAPAGRTAVLPSLRPPAEPPPL